MTPGKHLVAGAGGLHIFFLPLATCLMFVIGMAEVRVQTADNSSLESIVAAYRQYNCHNLETITAGMEEGMAKQPAASRQPWQRRIDAIAQVRADKRCDTKNLVSGPSESPRQKIMIGINVSSMSVTQAESLGLATNRGALVDAVVKNLPADKAGIVPTDVILGIDGAPIFRSEDVLVAVDQVSPGAKAEVQVWRSRKKMIFVVDFSAMTPNSSSTGSTK